MMARKINAIQEEKSEAEAASYMKTRKNTVKSCTKTLKTISGGGRATDQPLRNSKNCSSCDLTEAGKKR